MERDQLLQDLDVCRGELIGEREKAILLKDEQNKAEGGCSISVAQQA